MERGELKLNDFEGFEKFLFTEEERDLPDRVKWKKYLDIRNYYPERFYPPIINPKTIVELQTCHYAYWMIISVFKLRDKPLITNAHIYNWCYACHAKKYLFDESICRKGCPIKKWSNLILTEESYCGEDFSYYMQWQRCDGAVKANLARLIATLKWVDRNETLRSATDDSAV